MLQVLFFFSLLLLSYAQYKDGDIRLIGGSYQWEGRVEVYFSGVWGTITDPQWTSEDAQVVCRKMGYFKPGAISQVHAYFGEGSGAVHFDYVQCSGSEYGLTNCNTAKNVISTNHTEDVGVKCQPAPGSFRLGDIRLVGGSKNWVGRVEVYRSGAWGSVRDYSWTIYDAQVVCRQLGHDTNGTQTCCSNFGLSSGPIHISGVTCQGYEITINQCSLTYSSSGGPNVGVECQPGSLARNGDIRLVNGSFAWEGRVEMYFLGLWGTIYHTGDSKDARVVCRQLGYDIRYGYMDQIFLSSHFGHGTGPMHMGSISCTGLEYRLLNCIYYNRTRDHSRDWGISCKNNAPENGDVRLYFSPVNPSLSYGRVHVYMSDVWGKVKGSWTSTNANVVCRQLGYDFNSTTIYLRVYGYNIYSIPTHLSNVICQGSESRLIDCNATGSTLSNQDASMRCYSNVGLRNGDTRLVGGRNKREGRVEVYSRTVGRWGTVCDKQWTSAHTAVVCRHLGYSDQGGSYFSSAYFGQGTVINILMDYVNCSGSEQRLWDCIHFAHSYGCSHSNDVGVRCQPAQCVDGEIRLSEGDTEREGRLEVCLHQRWGTVSRSGWTVSNIHVACNQLGYPRGGQNSQLSFGRGGGPIYLIRVSCTGSELKLLDCAYTNPPHNTYRNDVQIQCNPASCIDGELRLVEGETEWEGRLEVCLSQRWGTVSNDGWMTANTQVVCRDLGYDINAVNALQESSVQPATGAKPIFMEKITCSGSELTLLDCTHNSNVQMKDHSKDVIMNCLQPTCNDGDIRLIHGDTEYDGLVEVCFNQRWGTVNGDGWSSVDAQVVCRQLGYSTEDVSFSLSGHKNRLSTPIFMDNVACSVLESKLTNCSYHRDTTEDSHSEDIIVHCAASSATEPFKQDSSFSISVASLIMVLGVCILLLVAFVVFVVYKHWKKKSIPSRGNNVACTNFTDISAANASTMSSDQKPVSRGYQDLILARPQTRSKASPYVIPPKPIPKNTSTGAGVKNGKEKHSNSYAESPDEVIYDNFL